MAQLAEAYVDIVGRDAGLKQALSKAETDVSKSVSSMQATIDKQAEAAAAAAEAHAAALERRMTMISQIGMGLTAAVTLPILGGLALALKAAADADDSVQRAQKRLREGIKELGIEFGKVLLPMLKTLITLVQHVITSLTNMSPAAKKVAVALALLLAAVNPLMAVWPLMPAAIYATGTALTFLAANPIVAAVAGIAALTAGVWAYKGALDALTGRKYQSSDMLGDDMNTLLNRKADLEDRLKASKQANVPHAQPRYTGTSMSDEIQYGTEWATKYSDAAKESRRIEQMDIEQELYDTNAAIERLQHAQSRLGKKKAEAAAAEERELVRAIKRETLKRQLSSMQALQIDKEAALEGVTSPELRSAITADYDDRIARERVRIAEELNAKLIQAETELAAKRAQIAAEAEAARAKAEAEAAAKRRDEIARQRSAWESVLDMAEGYTVRLVELAEGETAARMKALDIEATKRRDLIYANVKDEERRAMLMKALDADIGAQKADIMDEESKRADEEARAEAQRRRDKVGFAGGLTDVWRSAMTAGARLGVPVPPEVQSERYSKDQLEELKKIADWSEKQYLLAQSNLNKLATAESML
jgi:hypothetical protein